MKDYYCFEIEFPEIDFDNYYIKKESVSKIHHAHLSTKDNEIELKIFYDDKTYLGEKISMWASKISWRKFGSFIKLTKENQNDRLQKIDLSNSHLLGMTNSTSQYDGNSKFVIIRLDSVKFYWNPVKEELNTAEFYLADSAFRVVQSFYSVVFGFDGDFNISRMKGMDSFYSLGKSEFRPEFNFASSDARQNRIATITKTPKIQFKYKEPITEAEALFYGDVVSHLASFYHHIKIDYSLRRIHLPEHTITIKNVEDKNFLDTTGNFWGLNIFSDFDKFLQSDWQATTLKNFKLLSKAIELYTQALYVDSSSEFLIRYNIIEICNTTKSLNEKFKIEKSVPKKKKYKEALALLLETISPSEHKLFKDKWNSLSGKLQYKPMKSPLLSFFESQNLTPSEFPISVDNLKKLRDHITHGSIDKIDLEQLREANIFLKKINAILLLNMMGITDWKLKSQFD